MLEPEMRTDSTTSSCAGRLLRASREAAGISLAVIAERTHYSKPYLGLLETGKRPLSQEHLTAYAQVLGLDLERLASVAKTSLRVDAASLVEMATILSATRRLEDSAGSAAVLPAVQGYAVLSESLMSDAPLVTKHKIVSLASEIKQYQGWLELNCGNPNAAHQSFDRAILLAQESSDPDRLKHGLSFKGYAALDGRRMSEAAAFTDAALQITDTHPLLQVYDFYQRARIHAMAGEPYQAQKFLNTADKAAETAVDETPPDAGYWYTEGLWGLQRGRVLYLLGYQQEGTREIHQGLASMPKEHREAEWATRWVQVALGDYSK